MKYKYILPTLAAIGMLTVSCSNDDFLSNVQGGKGQEVTVSAVAGGGETRMAVTEKANGDVKFTWENTDKLYVINPINAEVTPFALSEGAGKVRGVFSGTPTQAYTTGQNLMAVFSNNAAAPVTINQERNGVYIDLSGQDGTLTDKYQYMFGQGTYQSDGNVDFELKNLVSVVKTTINNLPQNETISQIIFKDDNYSYRSNAYLMLKDGRHGDDEYHAGDLVRKGDVVDWNGQWNERVEAEDDFESAITLKGPFSVQEGSIAKYFYVMRTLSTAIYKNEDGSGVDNMPIWYHSYMNPSVLLIGNQHVYTAVDDYGNIVQAGTIYDMQLNAQTLPELTFDTPMQVASCDENYKELYYAFKAETADTYKVSGQTGYSLPLSDNGDILYAPNSSIELAAGEIVVFHFDNNSTVTIKKMEQLEVGKEYTVQEHDALNFTPTESGLYQFVGIHDDSMVQVSEVAGEFCPSIDGNMFNLQAGKTYTATFNANVSFTFTSVETAGTLTVGNTNSCITTGFEEEGGKIYKFNVPSPGIYKITIPNLNLSFLGGSPTRSDRFLETGGTEILILVKDTSPLYVWFPESEGGENINVAIEYLGSSFVTLTPGVQLNLSAGQFVLVPGTNVSTFYKAEGTALLNELDDLQYMYAQHYEDKLLSCKTAGSLTLSVIDKSNPVQEFTVNDQIELQAGKVYVLNVQESESGPYQITFSDGTLNKILGLHEYGYSHDIFRWDFLPSGKIYILSPKDVTITFTKE